MIAKFGDCAKLLRTERTSFLIHLLLIQYPQIWTLNKWINCKFPTFQILGRFHFCNIFPNCNCIIANALLSNLKNCWKHYFWPPINDRIKHSFHQYIRSIHINCLNDSLEIISWHSPSLYVRISIKTSPQNAVFRGLSACKKGRGRDQCEAHATDYPMQQNISSLVSYISMRRLSLNTAILLAEDTLCY